MSNFDPSSVTNLIGLWDFLSGGETNDTGLDDGIAQNGKFVGDANASGDQAHFDGLHDHFEVTGDNGGPKESVFDLSMGTIEVQFTQDEHVGTKPDVLVSRGEFADRADEGYFHIAVTKDGAIEVIHCDGDGEEVVSTTPPGITCPDHVINVKYTWDENTGVELVVENVTLGMTETVSATTTGLTMDIGDNDEQIFTFGARENDDGDYGQFFKGSIDYVAVYESENTGPDGVVDGEAFGETMVLGYDDANAPTNQGGDMITTGDDVIFGNGGDDSIEGDAGDDTIYGDSGTTGTPTREIFEWSDGPGFSDGANAPNFTQDTGSVNIAFSTVSASGGVETEYETEDQYTADLDPDVDENASLESVLNGDGNDATYKWEADAPVENVEFRINDIDGDGIVTVRAFDQFGNPVEVMLSEAGSGLSLSDTDAVAGNDTATSIDNGYGDDDDPDHSVLVNIAGPVSSWEVIHNQDGGFNSGINITDIAFDTNGGFGVPGNDTIVGGEGSDDMFGEDGDDTFIVSSGMEGDGDDIVGGNGPDDATDNDVLDLRGADVESIVAVSDLSDQDASTGTVTFAGGETLTFSQIETILTDPQNSPPDAVNDNVSTPEDTVITIDALANDTDPDGDPLTITGASVPAEQGTVEVIGNELVYTPAPDFNGPATISYSIEDGNGGTDVAEVLVNVTPVNDDPIAVDDLVDTPEDTPVVIDLLGNDSDPDGDPLTLDSVSVPPEQGTVVDNGDGTVTFTPTPDFNGPATIDYTVSDGNGGTDDGQAIVNVGATPDAPDAVDDTATTPEDTPVTIDVLDNDTDPDGDPLTITGASVPADQGTVEIVGNELLYTPAPDFNGPAEITYSITDGNGGTDTAMVNVTVTPVNDDPIAVDDIEATDVNEPVVVDLLGNDTDPDGDPLTLDSVSVPPEQGSVVDNGDGTVTFTPATDFSGPATIDYTVSDGNGGTDSAQAVVSVGTLNDSPIAEDDTGTTDQGEPVTVDVLANDSDPNGDPISVISATVPADQGTVEDNGDGTLTFTPDPDFVGDADITYTISDGNGLTDTGTLTVTVNPVAGPGPVDGTNDGEDMGPGYIDPQGDQIDGTDGNDDTIFGNDGDDTIDSGLGDDTVDGGSGDDVFDINDEGDGIDNDVIIGGETGETDGDRIDASDIDDDLIVDFTAPEEGTITDGTDTTTFEEIEAVETGDGDDTVTGGDGDEDITTNDGDDDITTGGGSDTVDAGDGDDVIDTSKPGLDLVDDKNGDGFGFASYGPFPAAPADTDPDDDRDFVMGGAGNDTITTGDDADTIDGGLGDDVIDSGIDNDEIFGMGGNDLIFGEDDDDTLMGGTGADTLDGGIDDDELFGDEGQDDLIGGQGADTMFGGDDRDEFFIDSSTDAFGDIADGGTGGNDVDTLDLRGLGRFEIVNQTVDADGDSTSGTVNFLTKAGDFEGSMQFIEIENLIPCFTPGSMVATPKGEVAVEALQVGDRVITRDDGIQEIQWIGKKKISTQDMMADPKLKPVMIKAGSLGNNLPEQDMLVSPNHHRMLIANENTQMLFDEREVLVAAKHLIGQPGVHQVDILGTEYIHVMFDRHQVILGDGAWTESFQPGDQTLGGFDAEQREEIFKLFPSLANEKGRRDYSAARQSLKAFEARTLRETMGGK